MNTSGASRAMSSSVMFRGTQMDDRFGGNTKVLSTVSARRPVNQNSGI